MKVMTPTAPSLRSRILRLFLSLMIVSSVTTIIAVLLATNQSAERHTIERLETGQKVFEQLLDYQANQLFDSAQLLTSDFGFKSAVSAGNRGTISSALDNHGERINADLMLIVSLEGGLIASGTTGKSVDASNFSLEHLIAQSEADGGLLTNVVISDSLYQIIIIPVLAPVPIAWAVIGFEINTTLAQELKSLTNLDVTIAGKNKSDFRVYASTINKANTLIGPDNNLKLIDEHDKAKHSGENSSARHRVFESNSDGEFIHLKSPLDSDKQTQLFSILSESLASEYELFVPLKIQMLLISGLTLLISVIGAMAISSNITRPITDLVRVTQRIRGGDYTENSGELPSSTEEISTLASSIQIMRQDIAEREQHIFYQLYHDMLTELPNRTKLREDVFKVVTEAAAEEQGFLLFELNLNRFKPINDTFGLEVGDLLLKGVANRLQTFMHERGDLYHLGADEFAIVVCQSKHIDESYVDVFGQELMTCFKEPFLIKDIEISMSARVGAVLFPQHGREAGQILRRANVALAQTKERKVDLSVYQQQSDQEHSKKIMLINDLKQAIGNDELSMNYQPKIDLSVLGVRQVEALIRWHHKELGFVSPAEFIPLAEQSGLMTELTEWVIATVVKQIQVWRADGVDVAAAINLSAHDLVCEHLPKQVLELLNEANLTPKDLVLEVTESAVMEDPELSISVLNNFRELGFELSIDDYGTGYSSLSQLKKMPVAELKIDMSFVRQLAQDTDDQVIVKSTIEMAHNIGLSVVAEGVEDQESWALLEAWGCNKLQGYFISKPLPADGFSDWYKSFDPNALRSA